MSKNNPNGAGQDSTFDYKTYEQNRRAESDKYANCMTVMAEKARKLPNIPRGWRVIRVCSILAPVVKTRRSLDCRGPSCHFKEYSDESTYCGILRRRNNTESAFNSSKSRFGTMFSAKTLKTQTMASWAWPSASTLFTSMGERYGIVGETAHIPAFPHPFGVKPRCDFNHNL